MILNENVVTTHGFSDNRSMTQVRTVHRERLLKMLNAATIASNAHSMAREADGSRLIDITIQKFKINQQYVHSQILIGPDLNANDASTVVPCTSRKVVKDMKSRSQTSVRNVFNNIFNMISHKEQEKARHVERINVFKKNRQLSDLSLQKTKTRNVGSFKGELYDSKISLVNKSSFARPYGKSFCDYYSHIVTHRFPFVATSVHQFEQGYRLPKTECPRYAFNRFTVDFRKKKWALIVNTGNFLGMMTNVKEKNTKKSLNIKFTARGGDDNDDFSSAREQAKHRANSFKKSSHNSLWLKKVDRLLAFFSLEEVNHIGYYDIKFDCRKKNERYLVVVENQEAQHLEYFFDKLYKDFMKEPLN